MSPDQLQALVLSLAARVAALERRRAFTEVDAEQALHAYAQARGVLPGAAIDFLAGELVDHGVLDATRARAFGQCLGAMVRGAPDGRALIGCFAVTRLQGGRRDGVLWQLHRLW